MDDNCDARKFKLSFPGGYFEENDPLKDNVDMHVITANGDVYVTTIITVEGIKHLMDIKADEDPERCYFWCDSFFIVRDFEIETIRIAIKDAIREEIILSGAFIRIGTEDEVYVNNEWYDLLDVKDRSVTFY